MSETLFGMVVKGALHRVETSDGYVRIHHYDDFARAVKEEITIKGREYVTERGYHKATDEVNWTRYPSGFATRLLRNAYNYPEKLVSHDVAGYHAYTAKYDEYKIKHKEATEAYEAVEEDLVVPEESAINSYLQPAEQSFLGGFLV